ncbi:hypothetical protein KSP39_PZI016702 [Platanthera zijinensis]|uniref:Sodium channel modifier 1 n=1 Tax=Platanthera zijinensis TaxID=2320716 RepID=A0AAP0B6X0_9ASPA
MSVFGGDSWVPEAQHRKRRVDDLMLSSSSSSYKKLANGKFACLVCPHNPVLDSPLILSMHMKGSRHTAAETKLKGKELSMHEELNKRIALSGDSKKFSNSSVSFSKLLDSTMQTKPLIAKTRQAILEAQCHWINEHNVKDFSTRSQQFQPTSSVVPANYNESISERIAVADSTVSNWNTEIQKKLEKELQFTAAGWKRDGHGKWYRDKNVEFDSDEEDPNFCFS